MTDETGEGRSLPVSDTGQGESAPEALPTGGEELLRAALARPAEAMVQARVVLSSTSDSASESYARQALGVIFRDRGETGPALRELRRALRAAERSGTARAADVRATLGATLVLSGRTAEGLEQLDAAARSVHGRDRATIVMRRAYVLIVIGRPQDALVDLRSALSALRRAGDAVWEARTLHNRGHVWITLGEVARAERDVVRAEAAFEASGQWLEAAQTLHNRGELANLRGDLPRAFALYDEAAQRYDQLGAHSAELVVDRCRAYLGAGLTRDAVELASRTLDEEPATSRHRSEIELILGLALLADGRPEEAGAAARRARRGFAKAGREFWVTRSALLQAQADRAAGRLGRRDLAQLRTLAERLSAARAPEAPLALLAAGRLALAAGAAEHEEKATAEARAELRAAARFRTRGAPRIRAVGWLALALDREAAGDSAGVLRAARSGLAVLIRHRETLGSPELRALAARDGDELAALGLRQLAKVGAGRRMLAWSERWRASALALPVVRPPDDPVEAEQLAGMRAVSRALDEARDEGRPTAQLAARLRELEGAIDRSRRTRAGVGRAHTPAGATIPGFDFGELVAALGPQILVDLVNVDSTLHGLVVRDGRVLHRRLGPLDDAVAAVNRARFALRQAARGRAVDVRSAAAQLQSALLGPLAGRLGDRPVLVVAPARLHHAPWGLCPSLGERPVSAAPSVSQWLRAARDVAAGGAPARGVDGLVLVSGPGLPAGEAEVRALGERARSAVVLCGADATVQRTLDELDGAAVGHIAAHGHHRSDNPMFSSIQLADGPLTVHDLADVRRPPTRVVLSACDSGVMSPVAAEETLGMAGALLAQGTAGVICAVSEVNDQATVPVMLAVHAALAAGSTPAEALLQARVAAEGDQLAAATAASFTCLGA